MRFKLQGHAEEVAAKYLAGESTPKIAAFYGVTATSVNQCLRRMGVSRRTLKESHPLQLKCKRGHPLDGDNTYVTPQGIRACRQCRRVYPPTANMKEYCKYWQIRKLYGLTREQYEAKLASQDNRCAICHREMVKPHLDHNHETKQVRDALCNNCNAAVGYVEENILTAESLVAYLKKWKTPYAIPSRTNQDTVSAGV
jgi:hypothetical protein